MWQEDRLVVFCIWFVFHSWLFVSDLFSLHASDLQKHSCLQANVRMDASRFAREPYLHHSSAWLSCSVVQTLSMTRAKANPYFLGEELKATQQSLTDSSICCALRCCLAQI